MYKSRGVKKPACPPACPCLSYSQKGRGEKKEKRPTTNVFRCTSFQFNGLAGIHAIRRGGETKMQMTPAFSLVPLSAMSGILA